MAQRTDESPDEGASERLRAAATRALEEAQLRRRAHSDDSARPPETGGPKGPEPVRYGDWDVKGRASDF